MKMDDSLLIAYVDGLLPPDERDKVEREIEQSPEAAACVERLYASRVRYSYAFAHQKLPALPTSLVDKVGEITRAHQGAPPQRPRTVARRRPRPIPSPMPPTARTTRFRHATPAPHRSYRFVQNCASRPRGSPSRLSRARFSAAPCCASDRASRPRLAPR